jgi:hypothetical protein
VAVVGVLDVYNLARGSDLGGARSRGLSMSLDQIYQTIKNLEETNFPIPTPSQVIDVLTFDAATKTFPHVLSSKRQVVDQDPRGHPIFGYVPPVVQIDAVTAVLRFTVVNSAAPFQVSVNGVGASGQSSLEISVGKAQSANWSFTMGGASRRDNLEISRPAIIGAGAFTIPALPVVIVYEPPIDQLKRNSQAYTETKSLGTTTSLSFAGERAVTGALEDIPALYGRFSSLAKLAPQGAAVGIALNLIADAIGTVSASFESVRAQSDGHSLSLNVTDATGLGTLSRAGPGHGDLIAYLKNAKLVWLAEGGDLTLGLLGYERFVISTADALRQGLTRLGVGGGIDAQLGLGADTIRALLSLDPFVSGELLDGNSRFVPPGEESGMPIIELHGGISFVSRLSHVVTSEDLAKRADSSVSIVDERAGWLGFLGIGVSEDRRTKTTTSNSASRTLTEGDHVDVQVQLFSAPNENYVVAPYYDRIFGTFALEYQSLLDAPINVGTAVDSQGEPIPYQVVSLTSGTKTYATIADGEGKYYFSAPGIDSEDVTIGFETVADQCSILRRLISDSAEAIADLEQSLAGLGPDDMVERRQIAQQISRARSAMNTAERRYQSLGCT